MGKWSDATVADFLMTLTSRSEYASAWLTIDSVNLRIKAFPIRIIAESVTY